MVNPIDDNFDAWTIFHPNPDVPAIIETDPERIALIMKNQKIIQRYSQQQAMVFSMVKKNKYCKLGLLFPNRQ